MKKVIAIILIVSALITQTFSLVACSDNTAETTNEVSTETQAEETVVTEETEDTYVYDSLEEQDFEGYKFRVLLTNVYPNRIFSEEYTGEPLNDAMFESTCAVQDRFNVVFVEADGGTDNSYAGIVKNSITSGDDAFDIICGHDNTTAQIGTQGYLHNMYDIPQFDFEKPWWPKNSVEAMTLDGRLYSASSYISYIGLGWTRATLINKDLADEYNFEVPYDVVREGNWTFDKMYTYLEGHSRDLDGDGVMTENDQVALAAGQHSWYCIQEGADVNCYKRDKDGIIYLDVDVERIAEYIEKTNKITDPAFYVRTSNQGTSMFTEGKALFAFSKIDDGYLVHRFNDVEYGYLPSPKLNEQQEDYINSCTDRLWGIPKNIMNDQLDIVGTISEAISCSNYNIVLPAYFDVTMKSRIADSPDDSEMLEIIRDTRTIAFAYTFGLPFDQLHTGNRNEQPASYVAKAKPVAEKMLRIFKNNLPD